MDNTLPELPAETPPDVRVPYLVPRDDARIDPRPIAELFAAKGHVGAEHVIGGALDQLAERVGKVEGLHQACRFGDLARMARSIVAIAREIGFRGVAQAADHVSDCALSRDPVALSATVARLGRMTDQSLATIWDLDPGQGGNR